MQPLVGGLDWWFALVVRFELLLLVEGCCQKVKWGGGSSKTGWGERENALFPVLLSLFPTRVFGACNLPWTRPIFVGRCRWEVRLVMVGHKVDGKQPQTSKPPMQIKQREAEGEIRRAGSSKLFSMDLMDAEGALALGLPRMVDAPYQAAPFFSAQVPRSETHVHADQELVGRQVKSN